MSESPFDKLRKEKKSSPHPFIEGRPVAMVAVWKLHEILHKKRAEIRDTWKYLSDSNMYPMRRARLTGWDSCFAWILDEINKLDTVMMK